MSAVERKLVHLYLQERGGVTTASEGSEPNRRIVVAPAEDDRPARRALARRAPRDARPHEHHRRRRGCAASTWTMPSPRSTSSPTGPSWTSARAAALRASASRRPGPELAGDAPRVERAQVRVPSGADRRLPERWRSSGPAPRSTRRAKAATRTRPRSPARLPPPPVAVEWCLPLVRPGGRLVLYAGEADEEQVGAGGRGGCRTPRARSFPWPARSAAGSWSWRRSGPTPERFPRRPGAAKKRPLA